MSEETDEEVAAEGKVTGRPWHLWLIGILSVLWGSMGCLDFTMTQTRNMAYLEAGGFTSEQIEFFVSFPLWANLLWAVAVWGGLLGAALLLAKKRAAVIVYTVALASYIFAVIYQYGTGMGDLFEGYATHVMSGVIFVFAVGQLLYARAMTSRGVLS